VPPPLWFALTPYREKVAEKLSPPQTKIFVAGDEKRECYNSRRFVIGFTSKSRVSKSDPILS